MSKTKKRKPSTQTNAQKRKAQKAVSRRKAYEKQRNIEKNLPPMRYRWDVYYEGHWVLGFKEYRTWEKVEAKLDETEKLREEGCEIIAGRIIDMMTGKVVKEVDPSPAKVQGKGALPDTIGEKQAGGKGILGLGEKAS